MSFSGYRLVEPIIAFQNRRRLNFAMKKLRPLLEERKAIIEHNSREKDNQLEEPVGNSCSSLTNLDVLTLYSSI